MGKASPDIGRAGADAASPAFFQILVLVEFVTPGGIGINFISIQSQRLSCSVSEEYDEQ